MAICCLNYYLCLLHLRNIYCFFTEISNFLGPDGSMQTELFDGQLNCTSSVKPESDFLSLQDDNYGFDSFDLVNFANANVACGTNSYSSNTSTQSTVQQIKPLPQNQKSSILLQQLKQNHIDNKPSQWQSQGISIADLLQTQELPIESGNFLMSSAPTEVASTDGAMLDDVTMELLAQAGIQQPAKRQIQLHSELVRHLSNQISDQQKSIDLQTPLQVL